MTTLASSLLRPASCCRWISVTAFLLVAALFASAPAGAAAAKARTPDGVAKAAPGGMPNMMGGASQAQPSFSVDMVMTNDGKTFTMTRTVDHGKSRMDMNADGHQISQIALDDEAGTMYTIMPDEKRAMKQTREGMEKMAPKAAKRAEEHAETASEPQSKPELVGKETIDGRPADKYKVSFGEGDAFMWIDSEKNVPLRMKSGDATVDFKNYQFGPQPAERFQPPKGYEIMDMDEMMAKMKGGGMGMGMGMPGVGSMAGGMAKGYAGSMGGSMGGALGGSIGGALGGPIGSMIGQYVGQKIGSKIGSSAAGAVLPGK